MSFVLEALKKHEASSNPETAAALAVAGIQQRRYRLWSGLAIAAMLVNLAAVLWLIGGPWLPAGSGSTPATAQASLPENLAATAATAAATAATAAAAAAAGEPPATADSPPELAPGADVASEPTIAAAATPAAATRAADNPVRQPVPEPVVQRVTRLALQDLPADVRRRFPGIAFSTHIYAEDRDLRAVVANGQRLTEGDRIRGLMIEEISESGVLLSFEDYLVDVPLITDWDSP
jgi:hypothetical protein